MTADEYERRKLEADSRLLKAIGLGCGLFVVGCILLGLALFLYLAGAGG